MGVSYWDMLDTPASVILSDLEMIHLEEQYKPQQTEPGQAA